MTTEITTPAVPSVHAAIVRAADALRQRGIAKNRSVTAGGSFRYRGIDEVYEALSPILAEQHLAIRPSRIEVLSAGTVKTTVAGKSDRVSRELRILIEYTITCAIDGSSLTFQSLGEGIDSSDKATGKALSYAYKNAIFQVFCVPVQGQPDPDEEVAETHGPVLEHDILASATAAANGGWRGYKAFFETTCTKEQRIALKASGDHDRLKVIARQADADGGDF
ncbi:ERF family protein [Sutterella sp.]|uniref:ERF family protein n=1 Tax=Sutterella sp. TaxID=1981025 RepID=UPI0026DF1134|nr:ERF family protein [Sutterella sp.]MDO5532873.1 ERF family protein [Sutterella sp.]